MLLVGGLQDTLYHCGMILWETKRTKANWSGVRWIHDKLKGGYACRQGGLLAVLSVSSVARRRETFRPRGWRMGL